ncbi:Inner membrane protein YqiK [Anatilimnocola aggregata]|uniref:Inner membrane protein YqiK n=1 Tax=Anatilimnocola aggregata TaxID=2528021 RepID=A0A517YHE2_9BACT|nr:flotillin family protein [Anatilimnocola aggregata]QDU29629.1 Inner membrane protein YqiK [Anatilimnocola aggregata]
MSHALLLADAATVAGIIGIIIVFVAIVFFGFIIMLVRQFKRCPSNRVLVIYGRTGKGGQASKTIHGGAAFVWPLVQDYAYLSLEPIQIEVPLRGALSSENIRVNVPSVFTVAIDTKPDVMQNAAVRLLGLSTQEVRKQAEEMIFGQLRQVIASMGIEEINRDRDKFLEHVQHSLEPELAKIGLQLINVNITDITDESGYIDAIGQKAASLAIQQARGDVADNEKMGETRVAAAERDKSIQVSNARKEQAIGTREAQRDQLVRVAALEKDQAVGEKQAAFEREASVKDAERHMRIQVAEADASAIDGENSSAARVAASAAELAIRKAEAYEKGEGRRKEAEAHVMEIQNRAMAKAALAEAERVEAEQRAKLEAPAKAQKAKQIVDAEAIAEKRLIEAKAEADAIFLKLEAEARGQYEMLAKKGEGLKQIVAACGGSNQAFQMLMLEHLDNLAEASAKAISNIKFDKVVVWEGGGANGRSSTADFLSGMARSLPPMMQVMRDIGGVELPESLVKLGTDLPSAAEPVVSRNGDSPAKSAKT